MRIIKERPVKSKKIWTHTATCGPIPGGPNILGCGAVVQLDMNDIFQKEVRTLQMSGQTFHWRCPFCKVHNFLDYNILEHRNVPDVTVYLQKLRENTILELVRLSPSHERDAVLTAIGNEYLLDDILISNIHRNL